MSATDKGADSATVATNALRTFEALANCCIVLAEAHIAAELPVMLLAASHKQAPVRAAAECAVLAFASKMSANAVTLVLKDLFSASEVGVAWQTRALALKAIASLADHAPEQLGASLPEVVPQVTISMNETKKEVSQAALGAMTAACEVIGNRDIEHMTSKIVRSITNPEVSHSIYGQGRKSPLFIPHLIYSVGRTGDHACTRRRYVRSIGPISCSRHGSALTHQRPKIETDGNPKTVLCHY